VTAPPLFTLREGGSKLLVSIPHAGTYLPPDLAARLTQAGRAVPDTDWHVDRLYDFLSELDVTVLVATHSRIVVDLNRGPEGARLYPGQAETGLCPTESFAGIRYYAGHPPDAADVTTRVATYWQPYHTALQAQLTRLQALHGDAVVLDGHSIHGSIPRLFDGALPDLNFGTYDDRAASPALAARIMAATAPYGFIQVLNGRFKGGYITRHYGNPAAGVQAIQLEMAWRCYLDESRPQGYDPSRAARLIDALRAVVRELLRA